MSEDAEISIPHDGKEKERKKSFQNGHDENKEPQKTSQQKSKKKLKSRSQDEKIKEENQRGNSGSIYHEENERITLQQNHKHKNKKSKRRAPRSPNDLEDSAQEKKSNLSIGDFANRNMDDINRNNNYHHEKLESKESDYEVKENSNIQDAEIDVDEDNLDAEIDKGYNTSKINHSEKEETGNVGAKQKSLSQKVKNVIGISTKTVSANNMDEDTQTNNSRNFELNDQDEIPNLSLNSAWDKPQIRNEGNIDMDNINEKNSQHSKFKRKLKGKALRPHSSKTETFPRDLHSQQSISMGEFANKNMDEIHTHRSQTASPEDMEGQNKLKNGEESNNEDETDKTHYEYYQIRTEEKEEDRNSDDDSTDLSDDDSTDSDEGGDQTDALKEQDETGENEDEEPDFDSEVKNTWNDLLGKVRNKSIKSSDDMKSALKPFLFTKKITREIVLRSKCRKYQDDEGNSLVHYLAKDCFHEILEEEKYVKKSDFQIKGRLGQIPIHFAAREGENVQKTTSTVKVLLIGRADYLLKDEFGKTVLHHAAENRNEKVR